MLRGVDISNLQGPPEAYRETDWYKAAQFVIVQAIRPPSPFRGWDVGGYTVAQLRAAKEDGKLVGIYIFVWATLGAGLARDLESRLSLVPGDLRLDMPPLVDIEDENGTRTDRVQAVLTARTVADAYALANNYPSSIGYSRDEYITDFLGGFWPLDWKYWQARLNNTDPPEEDLLPMRPLIQWTSTPVDTNIMLDSLIIPAQPVPHPEEEYVLIPDEYVTKFSLTDNHDITGLIANFEGVVSQVRDEGAAALGPCQAQLSGTRGAIAAAIATLTPAASSSTTN